MDSINAAVAAEGHLDQALLSDLARKSLKQYLQSQNGFSDLSTVQSLWAKLKDSALAKNMPEKHLTAACNSVSVFLAAASIARSDSIRSFVLSETCWHDATDCAEYAFSCGKTKPALQVLESLAQLSKQNPDQQLARELINGNARSTISTIVTDLPHGHVKADCIFLSCFIKKTRIVTNLAGLVYSCLQDEAVLVLWRQRRLANGMQAKEILSPGTAMREFFLGLLFAVNSLETRSAALKLFALLCSQPNICEGHPMDDAAAVLEEYISCNPDLLSDFADNVLPVILDQKSQFEAFLKLYSSSFTQSESRLILYLAVLKVGRLKSFISEKGAYQIIHIYQQADENPELPLMFAKRPEDSSSGRLKSSDGYQALNMLLRAGDPGVRIHTYDLITASFATKATVPVEILDCLRFSWRYLHDDNNAYERGELLGITRRFLKRLSNSYLSLLKLRSSGAIFGNKARDLVEYEEFIVHLANSLSQELEKGVTYQRHIIALQSLQQLSKAPFDRWSDNPILQKRVAALVLDAYDDVRELSSEILLLLYSRTSTLSQATRRGLADDAVNLAAQTCRHDHADAAGRMLAVTHQGKQATSAMGAGEMDGMQSLGTRPAQNLLAQLHAHLDDVLQLRPDSGFPLHAYILALTHLVPADTSAEEAKDILRICSDIWDCVKEELCVDSPETGTEDLEDDSLQGPKDLLAYAWRALRDSSLLLQALIRADQEQIQQAGSLCMQQLTQLRHRGAFSTVAQTFALCCDLARGSPDEYAKALINQWRTNAFAEIDIQASKVTRRSAGIPALFNAILSPSDPDMLEDVLVSLRAKSMQPVSGEELRLSEQSLPQVHALNCIKDIITHSKFRTATEKYIAGLISLAADGMSSNLWAVRNCGLMLLRACIMRLDSKMLSSLPANSVSIDAEKPGADPLDVALGLLNDAKTDFATNANDERDSEKIFAGLDLIKHIGTFKAIDGPVRELVGQQLGNPIWGIRDHAARVLADLEAPAAAWELLVQNCIITPLQSENEVHGRLLYLRYAFEVVAEQLTNSLWSRIDSALALLVEQLSLRRNARSVSPFTDAALLDVVNTVLKTALIRHLQTPFKLSADLDQPEHEASNKINAYYTQRYSLYRTLLLLGGHKSTETTFSVCSEDPDVVEYLADNLLQLSNIPLLNSTDPVLANIVAELCLATNCERALVSFMTTLAANLGCGKIKLSPALIGDLLNRCRGLPSDCGRDLQNSTIKLHSALVGLGSLPNTELVSSMRRLVTDVTTASQDELDFPTRLGAAQAVANCLREVFRRLVAFQAGSDQKIPLQLLLVLYDELNDDDEEIRDIAQEAAMEVLRPVRSATKPIPLCALASRRDLLDLIVGLYEATEMLPWVAAARLVGSRSQCDHSIFEVPVQAKLEGVLSSMNELFSEERQNLYIDQLSEIRRWKDVLQRCNITNLPVDLWMGSAQWCLAGIRSLRATLSRSSGDNGANDNMARLTKNLDVLELCLRVIQFGQALIAVVPPSTVETDVLGVSSLHGEVIQALQEWQSEIERADAHPLLLATIARHR